MAITGNALLVSGGGQISPALYGGAIEDDVLVTIERYLAVGYDKALASGIAVEDADSIAEAWAYYCFYAALLDRIAIRPSSVDVKDAVTTSWTTAQMAVFEKRAKYWLSLYEQAVEAGTREDEDLQGWASFKSLRYG